MEKIESTEREYQVVELLAKGLNNDEICKKLFITQNTIRTHLTNIYQKALLTKTDKGHSALRVKVVLKFLNGEFEKVDYKYSRKCTTCKFANIKDGVYLVCDIKGLLNDAMRRCKYWEEEENAKHL